MQLITPTKTTYHSIFQGDERDLEALLKFLVFRRDDGAERKIREHPEFAASDFWEDLANNLFVGFSSGKVLLCSGYEYPGSIAVPIDCLARRTLRHLIGFCGRKFWEFATRKPDVTRDRELMVRTFAEFYREPDWSTLCNPIFEISPYPYLRVLEAFTMAGLDKIGGRYLEVGAGNAVSIAHLAHASPGARFTVVDLPEMICAAYLLLRVANPNLKIALPNESGVDADIQFLLPYQAERVPVGTFDFAFNMASFQEMEQEVVNNYLRLFHRALRPGGRIALVNQERSRYIRGNCIEAYDLSGFGDVQIRDTPFANRTSAHPIGLNVKHVTAVRE
jgi:SAM-dependent methyltransferase